MSTAHLVLLKNLGFTKGWVGVCCLSLSSVCPVHVYSLLQGTGHQGQHGKSLEEILDLSYESLKQHRTI